nr:hypothetical protein GCM10020241_64970 [Streptoalloteichus tenebrarius]
MITPQPDRGHRLQGPHRWCLWREAPERFGPWQTLGERQSRWSADGTWSHLVNQVREGEPGQGVGLGGVGGIQPVSGCTIIVFEEGLADVRVTARAPRPCVRPERVIVDKGLLQPRQPGTPGPDDQIDYPEKE